MAELRIKKALIAVPTGVCLLCALCACGTKSRPPSVLLVTVDTLRADSLGAYGAEKTRTPNLDELAARGTVFERVAAPMPLTRPAHFSILTARYPREHGVLNNALVLPDSAVTLTEALRSRGYRTAGFVAVKLLGKDSGAAQGFEVFEHPTDPREAPAESVVPRAQEWVAGLGQEEAFFLWVHLFDPHLPYAPPEGFGPEVDPRLPGLPIGVDWDYFKRVAARNDGDVPARVLRHARALYAGEVEYVDHWFGELMRGVEAVGRASDLITVFTADHGESFEHGVFFEHADSLYQGAIHVPLIVQSPSGFQPGTRVAAQASSIDIAPTILRALGLEAPALYSGLPLQDEDALHERFVLIQHPFYQPRAAAGRPAKHRVIRSVAGMPTSEIIVDSELAGIVSEEWKYLRGAGIEGLYRLAPVEDEGANLAAEQPELREEMESVLEGLQKAHPLNLLEPAEINAELLDTLKALGYVY